MGSSVKSARAAPSLPGETAMPDEFQPQTETMGRARKAFERVGKISDRLAAPVRPATDRFFDLLLPTLPTAQEMNWGDEADWARLQQEPLRARFLLRIVCVVVALLLVWAGFAQIDEVTRGEGKIIPSSQMQTVTAIDGAPIKEILVRVGDVVENRQVLIQLDPVRLAVDLGVVRNDYLALKAKTARLQALVNGQPFVAPADVLEERPELAAREQGYFDSSNTEIESQLSIVRQQYTQREEEHKAAQAGYVSAVKIFDSAVKILKMKEPLVKDGAISEVELLEARQAVTKATSDRDKAAAEIPKTQAAIVELQHKLQSVELDARNKWSNELSESMAKLQSEEEKLRGGVDKVERSKVRSPMKGTVNYIYTNTVGSFVQAGAKLVDIVPLGDKLLVEAKIKPKDIAFLAVGMPARVKITAYDFAIFGGLDGKVEQISPDTVSDDKGNAFYLIQVSTDKSSLGKDKPITPGMVAEVDVLTGKKSVLNYLLKPVLRARQNAMTER